MKTNGNNIKPDWTGGTPQTRDFFFALLCGILFFLSFPKFGFGVIAWIALVPLFVALNNVSSLSRALLLGWTAGMAAYIGMLYWIAHVVVKDRKSVV